MYGYSKMTDQEVEEANNETADTDYGLKWWKHVMPWKNNHFNSVTASILATEINQRSNQYRKIDAWHAWSLSALGEPIEELITKQYNHSFDGQLYEQLTKDYINRYKLAKLS